MTKVAVKFLLACSALCQCGDVIECLLNRQDVRVQTHVEKRDRWSQRENWKLGGKKSGEVSEASMGP